jgi:GNAT superfamily N-acetyltransferase
MAPRRSRQERQEVKQRIWSSRTSPVPSTTELFVLGAPVELRDGSQVRLRQIRSSDRELLLRGFEHLSPKSRYRRFLTPMPELSEETVRYLVNVDHHDHEAIVAVDAKSGEGVGVARYVRSTDRPEAAEVAVTVIDAWQGRGLGTVLLEVLSARAREEGIRSFTALMLAENEEMMDLLGRLGAVRIIDQERGTVEIEVRIPEIGLAPALRKLLRIAAQTANAAPAQSVRK